MAKKTEKNKARSREEYTGIYEYWRTGRQEERSRTIAFGYAKKLLAQQLLNIFEKLSSSSPGARGAKGAATHSTSQNN